MTTLIVVTSNLEPPARSSNNFDLIPLVGQLELREEGLPSKSGENNPFEQPVVLKKTSCIENTNIYCIIIISKQMREFTLVNTISSAKETKPQRLLPSILVQRKFARMTRDKMRLLLLQNIRFACKTV
jgi:hypothetical protein